MAVLSPSHSTRWLDFVRGIYGLEKSTGGVEMKHIGNYEIGYEWVSLYVDPTTTGGSFHAIHKDDKRCRIVIGLDQPHFSQVLGVLIHEATEFCLMRFHARYSPSNEMANDHSAYLFSFGHVVLSETSFMVAELIDSCRDVLYEAWANKGDIE